MADNNRLYDVTVSGGGSIVNNSSKIKLTRAGVILLDDKCHVLLELTFSSIVSIQIHQPIFGANYIDIEYTSDTRETKKIVVSFIKGGATEFAQVFFRATEGIVTDPTPTDNSSTERTDSSAATGYDTSSNYKSSKKDN